jgi:hypothetical protein
MIVGHIKHFKVVVVQEEGITDGPGEIIVFEVKIKFFYIADGFKLYVLQDMRL